MAVQKSLKKNAFYSSIKSVMNIIFPIISFPYASRVLLPEGIGAVNFANSIIEYFLLIAELGIGTYAAREAARIRDDKHELSRLAREVLFFNFITTLVSYVLLVISLFVVPKFFEYRILLIVCSTKVLFSTLGIGWLYTAQEDYKYITVRHVSFQIISLILLFTLVKEQKDYLIYAGIGVFSNVGANIFNFIYSKKYINLREKTEIKISRHIKPILTFFSVDAAGKVNSVLDTIMLGFLSGNISVGLYIAATKLSKMIRQLITSIISTFMPRSSYLVKNSGSGEYKQLLTKVLAITFFLSIPAALGLFYLAEPLTYIFCGENYADSVPTMQLLSFCIIFASFNSYLNNLILTPNRLERFMLYAQLTALVVNGGLNWILITQGLKYGVAWGVFGAGIATLLVDLTLPIVKLTAGWKYIKDRKNLMDFIKALAGSVIMLLCLYGVLYKIENPVLKITLGVIVGTAVYAAVELAVKHTSAIMILQMFKKRYKR